MDQFIDLTNPTVEMYEIADGKLIIRIGAKDGAMSLVFEDEEAEEEFKQGINEALA